MGSRDKIKTGQEYRRVRDSGWKVSEGRKTFTVIRQIARSYGETWGVRYGNGDMGEINAMSIHLDYVLMGGDVDRFFQIKDRLVRVTGASSAEITDKKVKIDLDEFEHLVSLIVEADQS